MAKRALLIGINYAGTSAELTGCINDVANVRAFLMKACGYGEGDIVELTDMTKTKPTRAAIIRAVIDLILTGASTLYLHYSGHGSYVRDISGDEKDCRDECLVPLDFAESGMIIDDELRGLLQTLRADQHMTGVLDCCHSGTGLDLCYGLYESASHKDLSMHRERRSGSRTRGQVVFFSGCLDAQTSAEAWVEDEVQGAMTHAFLKAVSAGPKTYKELVIEIRLLLKKEGYSQLPTLTTGKYLNLSALLRI